MADEPQPNIIPPGEQAPPQPAQEPDPAAPAPDPATVGPPAEAAPQATPEQLVSDFKKDELQTAAEVQGADVPAKATKADLAEAIVSKQAPIAPVTVNNYTQRSDSDALEGGWVDVVDGPYAGRYGAYVQTMSHSDQNGYPETILVRTRDARNELIPVEYDHVRPSERTGGR